MNAAYVGILTPGSTSRMRAEWLRKLTPGWEWHWVDTDVPMRNSIRAWRSAAFRWNVGPAVQRINALVRKEIAGKALDLAWVDKAVFLEQNTVRVLRSASRKLVHFTPDTAFFANRSRHFERTAAMFDLLVTTKSFEFGEYQKLVAAENIHVTTQGFDPTVHFPRSGYESRVPEVAFVGLAEPDRERCISTLLGRGVAVRLAGSGWQRFVERYRRDPNLHFAGEEVYGADYATLLSRSWIGVGLLSKRFPELHTTRTFEIPACGTILATEVTPDTSRFFSESEALFFRNYGELADRVAQLFSSAPEAKMKAMAVAGKNRVHADGRDYPSILGAVLSNPRIAV